jgi:TolB-like protein
MGLAEGNGPNAVDGAAAKARLEPNPVAAVFISYASQDGLAAQRIAGALRAGGIEVWFDQSELRGGDAWDASIRQQIKGCYLFVPVISANTQLREEGYFRREWNLAVARTLDMAEDRAFLLPLIIDDTSDSEARVPEKFREVQWTRLPNGVTPAAFIDRVRRLLLRELSLGPARTASEAARASSVPTTRPRAPRSWRSNAALLVMIAAVVAVLGYLVANRLVLSKRLADAGAPTGAAAQNVPATAFNPPPHSIAVLPFVNMSGDPKQEYFSDGISEELLNSLSRLEQLQVAARTSSFSFKGQNVDVSTIARKLNVGAVLEGSVRRAGNTVRITVQLINAVSGFHMWSQTYDRSLTDILRVQADVATSVAQQLKVTLAGDESAELELGSTKNPEAYDAYLRGAQLLSNRDTGAADLRAALAALDQAIALDANFALAHAKRAFVLTAISVVAAKPAELAEVREQARKAAERAVALAPGLGEAHRTLAYVRWVALLDFAGALPEFDRALALSPGNANILRSFAGFNSELGRFQPAIIAGRRAVALDPQNVDAHIGLGQVLIRARRYDEALTALRAAASLRPNSRWVKINIAYALLASGQFEQAREICESALLATENGDRLQCLALAYHGLGRTRDAERILQEYEAVHRDYPSLELAAVYAQLGNKEAALQTLAKAEQLRDPTLQLLKVDWGLDPIRNDPQFKAIEARMNFPP